MSNLIDNHVPDFLLSPRFKFVRHFLLLLTLVCITISIFANQSGELVLTWERFYGWVFYFLLTSVIIYFNLYVSPSFFNKGPIIEISGIHVGTDIMLACIYRNFTDECSRG